MPPKGITSRTKNHILCCQRLISYSFWSERKSWISRGSSVAMNIYNIDFPFISSCARWQNRASRGGLKKHLSSSQVCLAEKTKPRFNEIIFRIEINPAQGGCRPIRRGPCVEILPPVHPRVASQGLEASGFQHDTGRLAELHRQEYFQCHVREFSCSL